MPKPTTPEMPIEMPIGTRISISANINKKPNKATKSLSIFYCAAPNLNKSQASGNNRS